MEIVWGGMIIACLALSIPFALPEAIEKIKTKTGEELRHDHLYWSIAPISWKSHRRERALFRKHCLILFYCAWAIVHVVFLTVITSVTVSIIVEYI